MEWQGDMSRILLIEDSLSQALTIRKSLAETAVRAEVLIATTGLTALKMLQESQPDIVVVDLGLPDMDGLEICRKLKNSVATRNITVIIHSVESRLPVFSAAFEAGADYYIPKGESSLNNLSALAKSVLRRNGEVAKAIPSRPASIQVMLAS